jgi:hypothetical protein
MKARSPGSARFTPLARSFLATCGIGCALLLAQCTPTEEIVALRKEVDELHKQSMVGWRTALCSREARILLAGVEPECWRTGACKVLDAKEITRRVCKLDPQRRERFLNTLREQPQEVFYLYSDSASLSDSSHKRLEDLIQDTPLLPTTRFLIVARPWDLEPDKEQNAQRRGAVVLREMVKLIQDVSAGVDASPSNIIQQRTLLWKYEFPLTVLTKRSTNPQAAARGARAHLTPGPKNVDAPAHDDYGVWVFRVDC